MGRRKHSTGVFRVDIGELAAPVQQIEAKWKYSDIRSLFLRVCKLSLCLESEAEEDIFPTVVRLREENGRQTHLDYYLFDATGYLLSHRFLDYRESFSRFEVKAEKYDRSIERLRAHRKAIKDMLASVSLPEDLAKDVTVRRLLNNETEE